MLEGVLLIPLSRIEDERGWFVEIRRESLLPKRTRQTNVSFSRRGVIRGLHYHERGQDDLFVCLQGSARVVVLDRESGEAVSVDIGDENPLAVYIPGHHAHGFEALTDLLFVYHVTEEYDPTDPDELMLAWNDARVRHLWSTRSPILSARDAAAASS
ncbi:MAG: dTDP-4-dehydrorhamnose 3,5-epimerase family protein [Actinomycetota bacterium]|nr:dTDP-4-dehydrorhamnose 3,5-epimerase family protein [Actinomycetota bacterium]